MAQPPDGAAPSHTNRLIHETSPYLLQHAHNPVDWHPWGPEAWDRARAEDKPVLVSIGYAACHWCHVMERESFENEATADRQNELFISIKVDREERPDVDEIYMEAVQLMRGQGGWPLNVFCMPDGRPFYGGTYFPPARRMGMPAWSDILEAVADAYQNKPDQVEQQAQELLDYLGRLGAGGAGAVNLDQAIDGAMHAVGEMYDAEHGGFGGAPKFPQPFLLGLMLQGALLRVHDDARTQVLVTLRRMAEGGLYDQLGGGFHRYSVDPQWLVPHFEKMLYDNALLPPLYLDAFRITGDPFYARIAEETLDYVVRDLTAPEGAFYASTDADSEGEEGKYFVWSLPEVQALLGDDALAFGAYYDVTAQGNWEGTNILHVAMPRAEVARDVNRSEAEVEALLAAGRARLLAARAERVPPATDTKIIVAWNGLMIDALARTAAVLDAPRFREAAERAATFLLATLRRPGGLQRIYAGGRASVAAFVDDYAALADGLLTLYEVSADERWFREAEALVQDMLAQFWDAERGGFFTTGSQNEPLVARAKPSYDGATPSGNSLAGRVLARLYAATADSTLAERLEQLTAAHATVLDRAPTAATLLLTALDWLRRHMAVAIVGEPGSPEAAALRRVVWEGMPRPMMVLAGPGGPESAVPQLRDKPPADGHALAYVCHGFACSAPVGDAEALRDLLVTGPPSA